MKKRRKKKLKLGLALGAGSARGLVHIGVLKVLHKHKIFPDYIAGTSMGAVIGAAYAAGRSPEEIEELAKTTDVRKVVDFTIPKAGLLRGKLAEKRIRRFIHDKSFAELKVPLRVISYNLTKHERVVFEKGSVAKAVRASISIPGVFAPCKIGKEQYIDGGVTDPTPFDIVRQMGAEVIIAIDLSRKEKTVTAPATQEPGLLDELKEKFIIDELFNVKNYIFPERWPRFIRKVLMWVFDKLLYPARVLRILSKRELPGIAKVMYESVSILTGNLARERISKADVDIKVTPTFGNLGWSDFDKVDEFVRIGERAMEKKIPELKKKLGG